ncbi:alanyl-tRNA editing protein [Halorarum salinum]|uniref:Alanyl-tRNA editing protein n=1 Tax=Halorarum salinum TaxID=2743089 RepID=A0A7D5LCE7_9EURY|nr:alanyl-tRNA editing protein [Halobaculum salinum]QLG63586.1 alanyl-tRNA editing protein [Halobaculum salinum]
MTEQRYLADSTVRTFEASVERTLEDRVVLDGTHFYPTGGGQPNDTGSLSFEGGEAAVVDVRKQDTIYHRLDGDVPAEGATVTGELDWNRRHAHMRYHTAQHLLSAVLLDGFDAQTVGNQLYADRARLDADHPKFSETDLADVEARMNELVEDGLAVDAYTMDRDVAEAELDAERTRIDLLPSSISELRIVEIGGDGPDDPFDRTACAGTHVADTGEVGEVTVTGRTTQGSDTERVEFTLG